MRAMRNKSANSGSLYGIIPLDLPILDRATFDKIENDIQLTADAMKLIFHKDSIINRWRYAA